MPVVLAPAVRSLPRKMFRCSDAVNHLPLSAPLLWAVEMKSGRLLVTSSDCAIYRLANGTEGFIRDCQNCKFVAIQAASEDAGPLIQMHSDYDHSNYQRTPLTNRKEQPLHSIDKCHSDHVMHP